MSTITLALDRAHHKMHPPRGVPLPDRVIFRKWKDNGDVIAWLPDSDANPNRCMSYMHLGQHGEGIYPAATVPAKPKEYRLLAEELRRLGYVLRVVKRLSWSDKL